EATPRQAAVLPRHRRPDRLRAAGEVAQPAGLESNPGPAAQRKGTHAGLARRQGDRADHDLVGSRKLRPVRYQVAFFLTALVALVVVVTLPFSVKSLVDDILGSAMGRVIPIASPGAGPPNGSASERLRSREANYTRLHVAVTAIDEVQLLATIRV